MSQAYSDPRRASDPHALPDVEVFYYDTGATDPYSLSHGEEPGWYWQACFPGCLPDGEPVGPFASEAEALADSQAGAE